MPYSEQKQHLTYRVVWTSHLAEEPVVFSFFLVAHVDVSMTDSDGVTWRFGFNTKADSITVKTLKEDACTR